MLPGSDPLLGHFVLSNSESLSICFSILIRKRIPDCIHELIQSHGKEAQAADCPNHNYFTENEIPSNPSLSNAAQVLVNVAAYDKKKKESLLLNESRWFR